MNCDDSPGLAWTQQDLYIPQPTIRAVWLDLNFGFFLCLPTFFLSKTILKIPEV